MTAATRRWEAQALDDVPTPDELELSPATRLAALLELLGPLLDCGWGHVAGRVAALPSEPWVAQIVSAALHQLREHGPGNGWAAWDGALDATTIAIELGAMHGIVHDYDSDVLWIWTPEMGLTFHDSCSYVAYHCDSCVDWRPDDGFAWGTANRNATDRVLALAFGGPTPDPIALETTATFFAGLFAPDDRSPADPIGHALRAIPSLGRGVERHIRLSTKRLADAAALSFGA